MNPVQSELRNFFLEFVLSGSDRLNLKTGMIYGGGGDIIYE